MTHYLSTDLNDGYYYIVPFLQNQQHVYVIQVNARHIADTLLLKINAKLLKIPSENSKNYSLKEKTRFPGLKGEVHVYVPS
jgi:hypothetical protein